MAAGKGQRIQDISDGKPKGFLKINGQPIIDFILKNFHNKKNIDIILVVGYKKGCYEKYLSDKKIKIVHNPFYDAGQVLSSFWFSLPFLDDNQDLIFCHADTIFEESILNDLIATSGDIVMAVSRTDVDEEAMKFILNSDKTQIIRISKNIPVKQAHGEFIGLCKITSKVLFSLKKTTVQLVSNSEERKHCYFEDAVELLYTQDNYVLKPSFTNGKKWVEIDDATDYKRALALFEK